MKTLGIDLGEKRIGIALSGENGLVAQGLCIIKCNGRELEQIAEIIQQNQIERIVYGLPLKNNGSLTSTGEKMLGLITKLKEIVKAEFIPWDERFTTREAENILKMTNMSRNKMKKITDKLAAQIILQSYLDSQILKDAPPEE